MSATTFLTDAATRHQVFLQRYAGGQSKEAVKGLSRLRRTINARLSQEPTVFQRNRLTALLADIESLSTEAFSDISQKSLHGAELLAQQEASYSVKLFNKVVKADVNFILPTDATLIAAVRGSFMGVNAMSGLTMEEAFRQFGAKKTAQLTQAIADGVALGDTSPMIAQKLGAMTGTLQKRQLDALVRTATNHASSVARKAVYDANSRILDGAKFVATLDSATTLVCGGNDGKMVVPDGPAPYPPLHWNCRSTTVPVVKKEFSLASGLKGERSSKGAEGSEAVAGTSTYGGWLRKQPAEFQDEALGVERARLFRSGKVPIDGFTDPTGRVYTLTELDNMNGITFLE